MGRHAEDLTSRRFGKLVVKARVLPSNGKDAEWQCLCDCGTWKTATAGHLKHGTTSCGCAQGKYRTDLSGQLFGHLTVQQESELRGPQQRVYWRVQCTCRNTKFVGAAELTSGKVTSCGCQRGQARGAQLRTHGESYKNRTAEYVVWTQMLGRCNNKDNVNYKNYGGRGITVCAHWQGADGFQHFLEDMGRRPSSQHSIERKNNDGNYDPDNCIWATRLVQMANKRDNHYLTYEGETLHIAEWARRKGINSTTIRQRLKRGWPMENVLRPCNSRQFSGIR